MQSLKDLIFILFLLIFASNIALSQKANVRAEVDAYEYQIGDHIKVDLEATFPKDWKVVFPTMSDTINSFELINFSKLDTISLENSENIKISRRLTLIQFDSGDYVIPPFDFVFDPGKNELGQFIPKKTNPIDVKVTTVTIDTTQAYKDIKGNLEPEFSIWEYKNEIMIGSGILLVLIVLYFIWRKYFKNKKKEEETLQNFDPTIEPHILALGSLKKLEEKSLWQNAKYKDYYTELTEILRIYISRCFSIDSLEMTSDEILESFKKKSKKEELSDNLKTIFKRADLVKFAKSKPLPDENDESLNLAVEFVNSTIEDSIASMDQGSEKEPSEAKNV